MPEIDVRARLPRDAAWIGAAAMLCYASLSVAEHGFGYDAHAYWLAGRELSYGAKPGQQDAFLYSPLFAQVISPLAQLPFPLFCATFIGAAAMAFAWLLKPLGREWAVPVWLCCVDEIQSGNVFWALALVAVLGLRFPAAWTLAALTKVTPFLGPIWFGARREWSNLAHSLISCSGFVAISFIISPDAWREWLTFLLANADSAAGPVGTPLSPPLAIRLPVAVLLVFYGARTERRWLIPVAMAIATPVFAHAALTMLTAIPRLKMLDRERSAAA